MLICLAVERKIIGNLSTRRSWYHGRQPEVILQLDSHCACQEVLEPRSRTSGFFEEYSSYKSGNSSSEIMFSS